MLNNLPVYLHTYQLQIYLQHLVHNFKKEYKYTLGREIVEKNFRVLDAILAANARPRQEKAKEIQAASVAFDQMKTRLRVAHESRRTQRTALLLVLSLLFVLPLCRFTFQAFEELSECSEDDQKLLVISADFRAAGNRFTHMARGNKLPHAMRYAPAA